MPLKVSRLRIPMTTGDAEPKAKPGSSRAEAESEPRDAADVARPRAEVQRSFRRRRRCSGWQWGAKGLATDM